MLAMLVPSASEISGCAATAVSILAVMYSGCMFMFRLPALALVLLLL